MGPDLELVLTDCGLEQRGKYVQPERHDEYVCEIVPVGLAPFRGSVSSSAFPDSSEEECVCVNLVLLGDPNAGKTTLLHAFVSGEDPSFLRLTSFLPIIQASFTNCRLAACLDATLSCNEKSDPASLAERAGRLLAASRDELPFLDSDVARASVLLTSDDLFFFLSEFKSLERLQKGLPSPLLRRLERSPYAILHFLELGGDHLNRMCRFTEARRPCLCGQPLAKSEESVVREASVKSGQEEDCWRLLPACVSCDKRAALSVLEGEASSQLLEKTRPSSNKCESEASSNDEASRLAAKEALASRVASLVRRSFDLVDSSALLIYFVNIRSLFGLSASEPCGRLAANSRPPRVLVKEEFGALLQRLNRAASPGIAESVSRREKPSAFWRGIFVLLSRVPLCECSLAEEGRSSTEGCSWLDWQRSFKNALDVVLEVASANPLTADERRFSEETRTDEEKNESLSRLYGAFRAFETSEAFQALRVGSENPDSEDSDSSWKPFDEALPKAQAEKARRQEGLVRRSCFARFGILLFAFFWKTNWSPAALLPCRRELTLLGVSVVSLLEEARDFCSEAPISPSKQSLSSMRLCVPSLVQTVAASLGLWAVAEQQKLLAELHERQSLDEKENETETDGKKKEQGAEARPAAMGGSDFLEGPTGRLLVSRFRSFAKNLRETPVPDESSSESAVSSFGASRTLRLWASRIDWQEFLAREEEDASLAQTDDEREEQTHPADPQSKSLSTHWVEETGEVIFLKDPSGNHPSDCRVLPPTACLFEFSALTRSLISGGLLLPPHPSSPSACGSCWPPVDLVLKSGCKEGLSPIRLRLKVCEENSREAVVAFSEASVVRLPFHAALAELVDFIFQQISDGLIPLPDPLTRGLDGAADLFGCSLESFPEAFEKAETAVLAALRSASRHWLSVANSYLKLDFCESVDTPHLKASTTEEEERLPPSAVLNSACSRLLHLAGDLAQLRSLSPWRRRSSSLSADGVLCQDRQAPVEGGVKVKEVTLDLPSKSTEAACLKSLSLHSAATSALQWELKKLGLEFCFEK